MQLIVACAGQVSPGAAVHSGSALSAAFFQGRRAMLAGAIVKNRPAASMAQRIGFIGAGLMGHGMAKNIVEKGYPLTVLAHRNRAPIEDLLARGATEAKSPAAKTVAVKSAVKSAGAKTASSTKAPAAV